MDDDISAEVIRILNRELKETQARLKSTEEVRLGITGYLCVLTTFPRAFIGAERLPSSAAGGTVGNR